MTPLEYTSPTVTTVTIVTTEKGAAELHACGAPARGVELIVDALEDPEGLRRAHARLFAERGVRYLDCEGGQTVLAALRKANLLDEVFVTQTDVTIDESRHSGVLKIFDFEREGAELIADGTVPDDPGWCFRRWRFNRADAY